MLVMRIMFWEVDNQVYRPLHPFDGYLNYNEAHSCIYLAQHGAEFAVYRSQLKKRFSEVKSKVRMHEAKILIYHLSLHIMEQ